MPSPEPVAKSKIAKVLNRLENEIAKRKTSVNRDVNQDIKSHKKRKISKSIVYN